MTRTPKCRDCGAPAVAWDECHRHRPVCAQAIASLRVGHRLTIITRQALGLPPLPKVAK